MRIVYIGLVDFSYHCLGEVLKNGGDVTGVVTSKETAANSDYCDLTPLARHHAIPIHYCRNVNDPETVAWIREKRPDIIFCWGWSQLIKDTLLPLPPMGIVGVHPALLPQNRGRHPLIWALVLGLDESGLTFFFMDEGADSGPILSQRRFGITHQDTATTLYERIKELATIQIAEFLPQLIARTHEPVQQDHGKANYWRKRTVRDGMIDWRMNAESIVNLVRALTRPYPGAQFDYREQSITVRQACRYEKDVPRNIEPGKIIEVSNGIPVVKCHDGAIALVRYEPHIDFTEGEYIG